MWKPALPRALRASAVAVTIGALALAGCGGDGSPEAPEVVLYTSQDSTYLEGFFTAFERDTGIRVRIRGDTEASKTVGLTQRLLAERERPRADVFWNNEFANTVFLAKEGLFAPYDSPAAEGIPAAYRDPERRWTGFAARLRVFIVNTELLGDREPPSGWDDFVDERWLPGECALAHPLAGTTLTHVASLFARRGREQAGELLRAIAARGVPFPDGNAQVMKRVAAGDAVWGLTDTDDLHLALLADRPVKAVFPQSDCALVIPNTVALLAGAPHPENARRLIDYILSHETERRLAASASAQFPVRPELAGPPAFGTLTSVTGGAPLPDFQAIASRIGDTAAFLETLW